MFDADFEAEKYLRFVKRGGDHNAWWHSKGFTDEQRRAVSDAIWRVRRERGGLRRVLGDLLAMEPPAVEFLGEQEMNVSEAKAMGCM